MEHTAYYSPEYGVDNYLYQIAIFIELISIYIQYLLSSVAERRDETSERVSPRLPQSSLCITFPIYNNFG